MPTSRAIEADDYIDLASAQLFEGSTDPDARQTTYAEVAGREVMRPERYLDPAINPFDEANKVAVTAACQTALDKVGLAGGGTVLFAQDTITTGLELRYPNINVRGEQPGRLYDTNGKGRIKLAAGATQSVLKILLACTAATIENACFDGNKDFCPSGLDGIEYEAAVSSTETNIIITHSRVLNAKRDGIGQGTHRRGSRISENYVYGCGRDGVSLGGSDNYVAGNAIGGHVRRCINVANWTQVLIANDIWDGESNIFLDTSARYITIIGNKIDRSRGSAIYCNDAQPPEAVSIIGNQFHGNVLGATSAPVVYLGANNATVTGNVFGPNSDDSTPANASYCIFVPAAASAGRHFISGNMIYGIPVSAGLLNYRGVDAFNEVYPRSALHQAARVEYAFGLGSSVLSAVPAAPWEGQMVLADRVTWDPLAKGSGGSYYVWYNGTTWAALDSQ
jgi:hypothetical protein